MISMSGWCDGMWPSSRRPGWLERVPWTWGEGSIAWLTGLGIERAGLGGCPRRQGRRPPTTSSTHALLVRMVRSALGRSGAARRGGPRVSWPSSASRWAVRIRCERGYTRQLPDLAVWVEDSSAPYAVIGETGRRREDRQKLILEGWRDAIIAGRYAGVRFDCASAPAALLDPAPGKEGLSDLARFSPLYRCALRRSPPSPPPPRRTSSRATISSPAVTRPLAQETGRTTTVRVRAPTKPVSMQREMPEVPSALNTRQPRTPKLASGSTARSSDSPSQRSAGDGAGDSDEGGLGATPPGVTAGGFDCISRRPEQFSSRPSVVRSYGRRTPTESYLRAQQGPLRGERSRA